MTAPPDDAPLILIVETAPSQAARTEAALRRHGWRTTLATRLERALALAGQDRPALVVAGMDPAGEACHALCLELQAQDIAFVLHCECGDPQTRATAEALGAAGLAAKNDGLDALAELAAQVLAPASAALPRLQVLVADDNRVNRTLAEWALTKAGHQAAAADCGETAVLMALERHFDLILMDVEMPDIDGGEAARRIRSQDGPCRETPILALTGHSKDELASRFAAAFDGHVPKPFELTGFEAEAMRVLGFIKPFPLARICRKA